MVAPSARIREYTESLQLESIERSVDIQTISSVKRTLRVLMTIVLYHNEVSPMMNIYSSCQ